MWKNRLKTTDSNDIQSSQMKYRNKHSLGTVIHNLIALADKTADHNEDVER